MNGFRTLTLGLVASLLVTSAGCTRMLHDLKPHRMWRLNRVPKGMHKEAYFSVSDPIPERESPAEQAVVPQPEQTRTSEADEAVARLDRLRAKKAALRAELESIPFMQTMMAPPSRR